MIQEKEEELQRVKQELQKKNTDNQVLKAQMLQMEKSFEAQMQMKDKEVENRLEAYRDLKAVYKEKDKLHESL